MNAQMTISILTASEAGMALSAEIERLKELAERHPDVDSYRLRLECVTAAYAQICSGGL